MSGSRIAGEESLRGGASRETLGFSVVEYLVGLGDGRRPVVVDLAGNAGEEGEGGDELLVVGTAEQLAERDAGADDLFPDGFDEGAVAGPEDGVAKERSASVLSRMA